MKSNLLILTLLISLSAYSDEEFPAGTGTTSDLSVQAFSHPLSGVRGEDRRDFTLGNSFFQTSWVASPASTPLRDGLGPTYNAVSCTACHFKDGRGRGLPDEDGKTDISLLFRLRVKNIEGTLDAHPQYGGQFNPIGIENVSGEGQSFVKYETIKGEFADGEKFELIKPRYSFVNLSFGRLGDNVIISPRVGPQMIGLGLLENINEADIYSQEDENDKDSDGISGRANRVYSLVKQSIVLGRFGWKAGKSSLLEQNAAAFNGDIGITSYLFPEEDCPLVQIDCKANKTPDDISSHLLKKVTTYTQLLAVPMRRKMNSPKVLRGKELFNEMSCVKCHTPSYTTGDTSRFIVLNHQQIYPYTDLLLHDMGDELADSQGDDKNEEEATVREWRTPPLWGVGMFQIVNGHTRYMHDGRARNLAEAILWHGGEGQKARERFIKLSVADRESVVEFLKSL